MKLEVERDEWYVWHTCACVESCHERDVHRPQHDVVLGGLIFTTWVRLFSTQKRSEEHASGVKPTPSKSRPPELNLF